MPEWPGGRLDFLTQEKSVPLCTPELKARVAATRRADLVDAPLLHLVSRPDAWERWFAAHDVDPGEVHGMLFDQFLLGLEAARAGLGIALLPEFLARPELDRGELLALLDAPYPGPEPYSLASPDTYKSHPPLDVFGTCLRRAIPAH